MDIMGQTPKGRQNREKNGLSHRLSGAPHMRVENVMRTYQSEATNEFKFGQAESCQLPPSRWPVPSEIKRNSLINDASFIENITTVSMARRQSSWEIVRGSDRFVFCIANDCHVNDFRLDFVPDSDILSLRFIRSGELALRSSIDGDVNVSAHMASLHKMIGGHSYELGIDKDQLLQSVTLHFPAEYIWNEIGLDPNDISLNLQKYILFSDELSMNYFMSTAMSEIVISMIDCKLTGNIRRNYLSVKAKELLYLFVHRAQNNAAGSDCIDFSLLKHKSKIFAAREVILKNLASSPSINEMSREVGLNRTTLQKGFKSIFGISISDYAREKLMAMARDLLDNLTLSIAEIADDLGYEHHTNFTAAFKKYHGYSPSFYRSMIKSNVPVGHEPSSNSLIG
jgi:AraC family transcriptional regulator, transcriptional activator of the genes for pyochelin and ferripyochelin receptors